MGSGRPSGRSVGRRTTFDSIPLADRMCMRAFCESVFGILVYKQIIILKTDELRLKWTRELRQQASTSIHINIFSIHTLPTWFVPSLKKIHFYHWFCSTVRDFRFVPAQKVGEWKHFVLIYSEFQLIRVNSQFYRFQGKIELIKSARKSHGHQARFGKMSRHHKRALRMQFIVGCF